MTKPAMFVRSIVTSKLVAFLKSTKVGDVVSYAALTDVSGHSVIGSYGRSALASARGILLKEDRIVFGTIVKVGLKRLDDVEIVNTAPSFVKKIRNTSKRALKTLAGVQEFEKLPNNKKVEHLASSAQFGAIYQASSKQEFKRLIQTASPKQLEDAAHMAVDKFKNRG